MSFFLSPHLLLYSLTLPASSTSSTCPFHEPWHRDSHHPLDLSSPGMPLHWPSHPPTPPSLCVAMSAHPVFVPLEGDTLGKPKQLMQSACSKSTSMKSVTVKGYQWHGAVMCVVPGYVLLPIASCPPPNLFYKQYCQSMLLYLRPYTVYSRSGLAD
ncbi:hypothetical protein C8R44DRAFT_753693 [Mycena epipterygia]|nr:hypothetical protein C8R44DRAFT_753693 [Mycena epipterygia]